MLKRLSQALLLSLVCGAADGLAASLPDFKATYELSRGAVKIGNATIELSNGSNGIYTYRSRSWPSSWIAWLQKDNRIETSKGRLTASGIRPENYHYRRTGGSLERDANLVFDWETGSVENNIEDSRWIMEIPPGTLDKLVSQLGMMLALADGETDITFSVADGGKLKEYRFTVTGRETLELPAGTFDTVRITRVRNNNARETIFWCAPELHYLPVRIRQQEEDSDYQSDLESFSEALRVRIAPAVEPDS